MTPRFVLAKYVPDLGRMEPRNIGVFLWWRGEVAMKFLDAGDASFVNEIDTYQRWLDFWQKRLAGDSIAPARGKPVSKADPSCLEALISTQKGNYLLVDGGELLYPIHKREIVSATNYLFNDLIAPVVKTPEAPARGPGKDLQHICDSLFERAGLTTRPDFKKKYELECGVFGAPRRFHFSYGIGNGRPLAVYQRVHLANEQSVNSAALMIREVTDDAIIQHEHCSALVRKIDIKTDIAQEGFEWLSKICPVVDVDEVGAIEQIVSRVPTGNPRLH